MEGVPGNPTESRLHKVQNRPIERFQTEVLPPKSAKPISVTHHKLLSPIKSPGFIPTNNVAYIVEAAAKIIESSPQPGKNSKMPSIGSSSVPLRIQDIREKMEAAHKASSIQTRETGTVRSTKGKPVERISNGSEHTGAVTSSAVSEKRSPENLRNKGKTISLAVQAKVNIQRREKSASGSSRTSVNQKDQNEVKSNATFKGQTNTQKTEQKRNSFNKTNNVLRQNNQKQNSAAGKDNSISKSSVQTQQARKCHSSGTSKMTNKVISVEAGSRKIGSVAANRGREPSISKPKNTSRKKQPVDVDAESEESIADNVLINKVEKSIKCNVEVDSHDNWSTNNKNNGMDVVSFTFTSPMKGSTLKSQSSGRVRERSSSFVVHSSCENAQSRLKDSTLSSARLNGIGGDALSVLLEQKLKELAYKVESPNCNVINKSNSANSASGALSMQNSASTTSVTSNSAEQEGCFKGFQTDLFSDNTNTISDHDYSQEGMVNNSQQELDIVEEEVRGDGKCSQTENRLLRSGNMQEPYALNCSPMTSRCLVNAETVKGHDWCSVVLEQQAFRCLSVDDESQTVEDKTELSESSSSNSGGYVGRTQSLTDDGRSSFDWEVEYVRDVVSNAELMLKDYALGQAQKVISPYLFDQLECQEDGKEEWEDHSKLARKVLFDCVSDCLELRCGQVFAGSCRAWTIWATGLERREWLVEEVLREISGCKSMGNLMVDELVDKDMSKHHGRWLDFEREALEQGIEIEKGILSNLVDELVSDLYC